ncbi:MAG: hypothetical protein AAF518_11270 [Spirochaetota bacterium]
MGQQFSLDDPPEKNMKDGIYTIVGGGVLAGIDFLLHLAELYIEFIGMPIYVLGGLISAIGLVMLLIGVVRKFKSKNKPSGEEASDRDNSIS